MKYLEIVKTNVERIGSYSISLGHVIDLGSDFNLYGDQIRF